MISDEVEHPRRYFTCDGLESDIFNLEVTAFGNVTLLKRIEIIISINKKFNLTPKQPAPIRGAQRAGLLILIRIKIIILL